MLSESLKALVAEVKAVAADFAANSSANEGITAALFTVDPAGARIVAMVPEFNYGVMGQALIQRVTSGCAEGTACVLVHEVFRIPEQHRDRFYDRLGRRIVNARDLPADELDALGVGDALVILAWEHTAGRPDLHEVDSEWAPIARDRRSVGEWQPRTSIPVPPVAPTEQLGAPSSPADVRPPSTPPRAGREA